jgi:hypothetical protein
MGLLLSLCHDYGRWRGRGSGKELLILVAHWPLKQRPLYEVHEVGPSFHVRDVTFFSISTISYFTGWGVSSVLPAGCWIDQIRVTRRRMCPANTALEKNPKQVLPSVNQAIYSRV